jgi:hypothetical protein
MIEATSNKSGKSRCVSKNTITKRKASLYVSRSQYDKMLLSRLFRFALIIAGTLVLMLAFTIRAEIIYQDSTCSGSIVICPKYDAPIRYDSIMIVGVDDSGIWIGRYKQPSIRFPLDASIHYLSSTAVRPDGSTKDSL